MTPEQLGILDKLVEEIMKAKILGEIQKLMFDRAHFARFLIANQYDIKKTIAHFEEYLGWRKSQKIDNLMVNICLTRFRSWSSSNTTI